MNARIQIQEQVYDADLTSPLDISIPVRNGVENPNCYGADPVVFETIKTDNFIGSVRLGGSVNYQKLFITPHGNGTHTECYGHIVDSADTIQSCLTNFHFVGQLISITPEKQPNGDATITLQSLKEKIDSKDVPQALIIRTLPNLNEKKNKQYTGSNPPYFEKDALAWMATLEIQHLLTDLPSVDKEVDGGKLLAHHAFWNTPEKTRKNATITELIFVNNEIDDGIYLVNLQIISLEMDASPSKPILYKLKEVS
jgi:kynurenine formamidase